MSAATENAPSEIPGPTVADAPAPAPSPAPAPPAPTMGSGGGGGGGASNAGSFHSASLYVGDLNPEINEGFLFEIFNAVGPVASIRVCRDAVTRRSLGYAYINFHQVADAERALDTMNYTDIKGRPCRIMWSQRDPSLRRSNVGNIFVKNLHESIDNKQLYDTFSLFGNILSCKVVQDPATLLSKGYGYVHYETQEAADEAIEKLDGMLIDGKEVQVGAFMRRNDRPGLNDWTNCFVKNIPTEWDDAKLREVFEAYGEIVSAAIALGTPKPRKVKEEGSSAEDTPADEPVSEEGAIETEAEEKPADEEAEKKEEEKVEDKPNDKANLGYGFVNFLEHEGAARAVEELCGKMFTVTVDGEVTEMELFVGRAQKKAERERELRNKFETLKMERISKFQGINLYVKNLDDAVTDEQIREEFSPYGTITSSRVMKDPKDGRSRGFGFVCFSAPEEATRAVNEMNGKLVNNKPIFVALAQRKEVRRAQLEAQHSSHPGMGGGPQGPGMMRGMGGPGPQGMYGPPGGQGMPMYMQRPGPGGSMQPAYPMMPQIMGGRGGGQQQPRGGGGQYGPGGPMGQPPQRGGYPMPGYGMSPAQPGRGGVPGSMQGRGGPQQGRGRGMPGRGGPGGRGGPMQGGGRGAPGGPMQQQMKFNQQARNAGIMPGGAPMQQQAPPGGQGPQPPQQQQGPPQPEGSLTASALASASPEMQKNMIGERLYPLIHQQQPDLAGKITGMLLEMDNSELLHLLESPEALNSKISEALQVLEAHNASA
jgi:polyadenylate-binding protein